MSSGDSISYSSIAAFDLDHTILTGNSSAHFGRFLYREKRLSLGKALWIASWYAAHKLAGVVSLSTLHRRVMPCFQQEREDEMQRLVDLFLDSHLDSLVRLPLLERLLQEQAAGAYTLLLSNSPAALVESIGRRLGFDESVGTSYGTDHNRRWNGEIHSFEGATKASYLKEVVGRVNPSSNRIGAYSDSHLDLPLLEAASHPFAVAPDRRLERVARQRGWTIIY